jgi:hypothetical protein
MDAGDIHQLVCKAHVRLTPVGQDEFLMGSVDPALEPWKAIIDEVGMAELSA